MCRVGEGFQGQYVGQEAERRALVQHQYDTLRSSGRLLESLRQRQLTPSAYNLDVDIGRRRGGVLRTLLLLVLGAAVVYGALWGVLALTSSSVPLPTGV